MGKIAAAFEDFLDGSSNWGTSLKVALMNRVIFSNATLIFVICWKIQPIKQSLHAKQFYERRMRTCTVNIVLGVAQIRRPITAHFI